MFCKEVADTSKSIEHIIPESLGNIEHVLQPGIVCDDCNNYFAIKIEKVLLEQPYFKSLRHRNDIISKKGNYVPEKGIILHPQGGPVNVYREKNRIIVDMNEQIAGLVKSGLVNKLLIPTGELEPAPNNTILSRFLAKVSVEALLHWIKDEPFWIEEIMTKPELDDIKMYARYGKTVKFWPYHQRRIYNEEDRFLNPELQKDPYEVLHEFRFFWTKENEFYFVLAIMGIEYAINMGGPSIDSYKTWLLENNARSILEWDKEQLIKGGN
ncbi:MAG: hypothetical protein KF741_13185 [Ferruginibacter sp.]|nr:HNH endonuclease [Bacteroidota bacterium]MBX2920191.1 hypothetical protein [Ferruginibacter sp.]